jgi:hypothetical protein
VKGALKDGQSGGVMGVVNKQARAAMMGKMPTGFAGVLTVLAGRAMALAQGQKDHG